MGQRTPILSDPSTICPNEISQNLCGNILNDPSTIYPNEISLFAAALLSGN
jgi:hypothetical protein